MSEFLFPKKDARVWCDYCRLPSLDSTEDVSSSDTLALMAEKDGEESLLPSEELEVRSARSGSGPGQEWSTLHERLFAIGEGKEEEEEEEGGERGGALLEEIKIRDKVY